MRTLHDIYPVGSLPPVRPHEARVHHMYNVAEYGEQTRNDGLIHALLAGLPGSFGRTASYAISDDPSRPARVYAPASARIIKDASPWDAEILASGRKHTITAEAAQHPGDRSDPAERL